jgi:hypothetical protein
MLNSDVAYRLGLNAHLCWVLAIGGGGFVIGED